MQISKKTFEVLKNFSQINANLYVEAGNSIKTIAVAKNIMGEVAIDEVFPSNFGIYNLPELLGVLSMMNNPDLTFEKDYILIQEGKSKMRYVYSDPSILTYPEKSIKLSSVDVQLNMTAVQINQLQKAAAAIGVQDIAIVGDGKSIVAQVVDKKNSTSNLYTVDLDTPTDLKFKVFFKTEYWKQITDDYSVEICKKNICKFTGKNHGVTYFVACEKDSEFEIM